MNEFISLLEQLIRCRPVTTDPVRVNLAVEVMRDFLTDRGVFCREEELAGRRILYASNRETGTPEILLNSHLDVVPADPEQFEPVALDGKLYARGSNDCLGNAVCLAQILLSTRVHIGAVFSTDEETGGETTSRMVDLGYRAKHAVLILDSSDPTIIYEQKGILVVRVTAKGRDGHAAYPWLCDNPIDKLMSGFAKFRAAWRNPVSETDWRNSMSACMMSAGSAPNQIPAEASMTINFRIIDDASRESILAALHDAMDCEVSIVNTIPPVAFDCREPVFTRLQETLSRTAYRGGGVPFARLCGATDSRHWQRTGLPVPVLGVAGANAHSANEYVVLDSIDQYAHAIAEYAETFAE